MEINKDTAKLSVTFLFHSVVPESLKKELKGFKTDSIPWE